MTEQPTRHQQRYPFVEKWAKRKPRVPSSPRAIAEQARREASRERVKKIMRDVERLRRKYGMEKPRDPVEDFQPRLLPALPAALKKSADRGRRKGGQGRLGEKRAEALRLSNERLAVAIEECTEE